MTESPTKDLESNEKEKPLIIGTVAGYPFEADFLLFPPEGRPSFKNKQGIEVAELNRFGFSPDGEETHRLRERVNLLLETFEPKEVTLRYGGLTEATISAATELVARGVKVNFERFNNQTKQYEGYYQISLDETGQLVTAPTGIDQRNLGTMKRHDYPPEVTEYLISTLETVARSYGPNNPNRPESTDAPIEQLFDKERDPVSPHSSGEKEVSVDYHSAPAQAYLRILDYIQRNSEVNHINLYYSGLTEVTVIAVFELLASKRSIQLFGHDMKTDTYQATSKLEVLDNPLTGKLDSVQQENYQKITKK